MELELLSEIRTCRVCAEHLPHAPRPVLQASAQARLLIVSQAPGRRVHASGLPFDDPSGERLRDWLGLDARTFYDSRRVAIIPMGFCYPGKGPSGDLPPRPECQRTWHERLLPQLASVRLTLAIGAYAQKYLLPEARRLTLTETVRRGRAIRNGILPLPHPSPRNSIWLARNPWFEEQTLRTLRNAVRRTLRVPASGQAPND